jgi:hypothetical protein
VAEHLLDGTKIRAAGQQVRGEAMPQGVGTDITLQPGRSGMLLDDSPQADPGKRTSRFRDQQRGRLGVA